ncbi:mucoidy inhibitor MuiA family protein [Vitiosangium sp. GDMCC 1.1324]|uniref:mucoidy inhibitor MuiA family protein n=1 Tax=Vitiosangium sp. (strain GDMCC 1.1324) TaxID=2138576 RepID=UPI000D3C1B92|nr:mucoidy inhibitor MuiA family protein [Vitiosangium sp. GDMCC 1.1324]PTL81295.1 oar precursor [Vitiosangium sp. GDMCC 1.1324]
MPVLGLSALSALWLAAVDAPVTSVTVYSDRARVVRTARVSLSGSQRVELPLLYGSVDPSSIRVEAQGAEVTRVDIRSAQPDVLPATDARRLVTELERLDDQLTQVRSEREAYTAQLTALGQVRPVASEEDVPTAPGKNAPQGPSRLDASGWRAATDFVVEATARLQAKLRDVSQREEALERDLSQRVQEARKLGGAPSRSGLEVVPTLSGQGPATLTLTYVTTGARWYPAYELRLEPESNRVQVAFAGRVSQETGEDWEDAALTLSTAIPASATTVPELATWKIGQRERFIPMPAPVADSWRSPPPAPPPPLREPSEDARLRDRLLALAGRSTPAPSAQKPPPAQTSQMEGSRQTEGSSIIIGTVVNAETKNPVSDVVVTATSPSLQGEQVVVTDVSGQYRIPQLPPGTYTLQYDKESFRPFRRSEIQLRLGRTLRVNTELLPETAVEEVLISGGPTVDVGSTSAGVSVNQEFAGRRAVSEVAVPVGLEPPTGWRRPELDPNLPASLAGGYALTFPAQRRETVRSGKGERRVPLFTETWPVQVERKLYPALTPNAFLVAELRSPSRQVMPGGDAQLFVGADPAGQARLSLVSPGEPFTLPLGIDAAVRPVRNVKLVTSEKGFIGKDELTEYLVTIEVANPYPFALPVRIHDQWPLSRSEDVEVKLVRTEPFAEQDPDEGTLVWRLSVPPSQKQGVSFLYTVRHPKGWRLEQSQ